MEIPLNKRFFRIGEASKIVGVPPYVLRYWESEFHQLKPRRADSKQRTYERKDLELLITIRKLLYEEKLTIEGAKKRLRLLSREKIPAQKIIEEVKEELSSILKTLS